MRGERGIEVGRIGVAGREREQLDVLPRDRA